MDTDPYYWQQNRYVASPFEERDPDAGTTVFARAFIAPQAIPFVTTNVRAYVWFSVDGSDLSTSDGPVLAEELRRFTSQIYDVGMHRESAERQYGGRSSTQ
jgi:hypothetical protein